MNLPQLARLCNYRFASLKSLDQIGQKQGSSRLAIASQAHLSGNVERRRDEEHSEAGGDHVASRPSSFNRAEQPVARRQGREEARQDTGGSESLADAYQCRGEDHRPVAQKEDP